MWELTRSFLVRFLSTVDALCTISGNEVLWVITAREKTEIVSYKSRYITCIRVAYKPLRITSQPPASEIIERIGSLTSPLLLSPPEMSIKRQSARIEKHGFAIFVRRKSTTSAGVRVSSQELLMFVRVLRRRIEGARTEFITSFISARLVCFMGIKHYKPDTHTLNQ